MLASIREYYERDGNGDGNGTELPSSKGANSQFHCFTVLFCFFFKSTDCTWFQIYMLVRDQFEPCDWT